MYEERAWGNDHMYVCVTTYRYIYIHMVLKNSNFRDQWKYGTSDGSQPQAGLCSRHTVTKRSMEKYVGISLEYRQRFTLGNAPQETYRLKREGTVSMSLTAYIIHWTAWGKNKETKPVVCHSQSTQALSFLTPFSLQRISLFSSLLEFCLNLWYKFSPSWSICNHN